MHKHNESFSDKSTFLVTDIQVIMLLKQLLLMYSLQNNKPKQCVLFRKIGPCSNLKVPDILNVYKPNYSKIDNKGFFNSINSKIPFL